MIFPGHPNGALAIACNNDFWEPIKLKLNNAMKAQQQVLGPWSRSVKCRVPTPIKLLMTSSKTNCEEIILYNVE